MKKFFVLFILVHFNAIAGENISYEEFVHKNHRVHLIKFDPSQHIPEPALAYNQLIGREEVSSIAKRKSAIAAINAGFFEIGGNLDGFPAGNLMIDRKWAAISSRKRAAMIITNDGEILFDRISVSYGIESDKKKIKPHRFNRPLKSENEIALLMAPFYQTSLTASQNWDFVFDRQGKLQDSSNQGDIMIDDQEGFIIAVGNGVKDQFNAQNVKLKAEVSSDFLNDHGEDFYEQKVKHVINGAGLLIANGKKISDFREAEKIDSGFVNKRYARTAIGIDQDGQGYFVVVDHVHAVDYRNISLLALSKTLLERGYNTAQVKTMPIEDALNVFKNAKEDDYTEGMTLYELQDYMESLGCKWAMNFDGGGSSTMVYENKIVNTPFGDEDEGEGEHKIRRVSDALILR